MKKLLLALSVLALFFGGIFATYPVKAQNVLAKEALEGTWDQEMQAYKFVFGSGTLASPCFMRQTFYVEWSGSQVRILDAPAPSLYKHCSQYPEYHWVGANINYTRGWYSSRYVAAGGMVYRYRNYQFTIMLECKVYAGTTGRAFCSRAKSY